VSLEGAEDKEGGDIGLAVGIFQEEAVFLIGDSLILIAPGHGEGDAVLNEGGQSVHGMMGEIVEVGKANAGISGGEFHGPGCRTKLGSGQIGGEVTEGDDGGVDIEASHLLGIVLGKIQGVSAAAGIAHGDTFGRKPILLRQMVHETGAGVAVCGGRQAVRVFSIDQMEALLKKGDLHGGEGIPVFGLHGVRLAGKRRLGIHDEALRAFVLEAF
jgi:hypothetical protein